MWMHERVNSETARTMRIHISRGVGDPLRSSSNHSKKMPQAVSAPQFPPPNTIPRRETNPRGNAKRHLERVVFFYDRVRDSSSKDGQENLVSDPRFA